MGPERALHVCGVYSSFLCACVAPLPTRILCWSEVDPCGVRQYGLYSERPMWCDYPSSCWQVVVVKRRVRLHVHACQVIGIVMPVLDCMLLLAAPFLFSSLHLCSSRAPNSLHCNGRNSVSVKSAGHREFVCRDGASSLALGTFGTLATVQCCTDVYAYSRRNSDYGFETWLLLYAGLQCVSTFLQSASAYNQLLVKYTATLLSITRSTGSSIIP